MVFLEIRKRDYETSKRWSFTSLGEAQIIVSKINEKYEKNKKHFESQTGELYDIVYVSLEEKRNDTRLNNPVKLSTVHLSSYDESIFKDLIKLVDKLVN